MPKRFTTAKFRTQKPIKPTVEAPMRQVSPFEILFNKIKKLMKQASVASAAVGSIALLDGCCFSINQKYNLVFYNDAVDAIP